MDHPIPSAQNVSFRSSCITSDVIFKQLHRAMNMSGKLYSDMTSTDFVKNNALSTRVMYKDTCAHKHK